MNQSIEAFFASPQFSIATNVSDTSLLQGLIDLERYHQGACSEYARIISTLFPATTNYADIGDLPYLPVQLFKQMELSSIRPEDVFKVLHSSGTTGGVPSRIVLDRETARLQTLALKHIMTSTLGSKRLPMLIVDSESITTSQGIHSARAAGVIGMMNFGRDHFFALDHNGALRLDEVLRWLVQHAAQPIFIFGFTAIVWHSLLLQLQMRIPRSAPTMLVHGGGWKKLASSAVSSQMFKARAHEVFGDCRVRDYYGMVEQIGNIYVECSEGFLHAPNFASVLIRDFRTLEPLPPHREGLIQVLSLLPKSYPGHSILTEDIGVLEGFDNCACGWHGPYFTVKGRLQRAELRGCSDTASIS